eukprot:1963536-Amphidinium_carterae.1
MLVSSAKVSSSILASTNAHAINHEQRSFDDSSFRACVLKGQAVRLHSLRPQPYIRLPQKYSNDGKHCKCMGDWIAYKVGPVDDT